MNKHSIQYLSTHDIDLFFRRGNRAIHCATNGGMIPGMLNQIKRINEAKRMAWNLPDFIPVEHLVINEEHIEDVVGRQRQFLQRMAEENETELQYFDQDLCRDLYLSSFLQMAVKGFQSYDRKISGSQNGRNDESLYSDYILVARPSEEYTEILLDNHVANHQDLPLIDISENLTDIGAYGLRMQVDLP